MTLKSKEQEERFRKLDHDFDVAHYNIDLGYGSKVDWSNKNAIIEVHKCRHGYLKHLPYVLCSLCQSSNTFRITVHEYEARNEPIGRWRYMENLSSEFAFDKEHREFEALMMLGRS